MTQSTPASAGLWLSQALSSFPPLSPLRGALMPSSPSCLPLTFQHLYSHFHEGAIFLLQLGLPHRTKLSWDPAK